MQPSIKKRLAIIILAFALFSCAGLSREQSMMWLDSKDSESSIDMTGKWDAGGIATGGWGEGNFIQEGDRFSGTLGLYNVNGKVTWDSVYMVLTSGGRVYYTARLKITDPERMNGKAVEGAIIDSSDAQYATSYLMTLRRF